MDCKQDKRRACALASKPSTAFSTVSSAASATSAGTSRSGGSRLLFGEIDTSSDRSIESYASVCSFVLCDSSTFLKFWLEDKCRERLLSFMSNRDLASLRLACHDFSVRAAPALFSDLQITFKTNTFTKPSKLAALDRLGFFVKELQFNMPHTVDTFLPPLVDPDSGAELSFTYTPQIQAEGSRAPRYGDAGTTEILTRQYPALFHAATNVAAFIRALSAFVNLEHLGISCPGYDASQRYRKSVVDYALISLRIAIEKNSLNALDSLSISPIHPGGLLSLSPLLGMGASPRSASRWARIRKLSIDAVHLSHAGGCYEPDQLKLLQTYLRNYQSRLETFRFRWIGQRGHLPVHRPYAPELSPHERHPAMLSQANPSKRLRPLRFMNLQIIEMENISAAASDISDFLASHKATVKELRFEGIDLTQGTWDDALAPMTKRSRRVPRNEVADIPIMLSPSAGATTFGGQAANVEVEHRDDGGYKSIRMSKWLLSKRKTANVPKKLRDGLLGCEEQLKKVLRGSAFPWG
ncbi:hypothetical protein CB0940_07763 [Cercospora beticola]|uniref:Uncharacterized protein n=1 Tax=Cercospora beticola TaxID=122368 RepID=A0A2G5H9Z9_CERBT|nr:hypothetical protein CB0940_07763 [Cercospora beticola]PIA89347.1 hypothetical protein CB0940_07763 [Cercospora beticola]WPB03732.1 hypothetical protein RHO25_008376 [Cercospora beticola]CAK1357507.1 unnamed protein product [Cercospora beticola]